MTIRRIKFPRSQGPLRSDWRDKSKPARVKITPPGSQKHHIIGDMHASRVAISIEGTNSGYVHVDSDQIVRAQHAQGETWVPFSTDEFNLLSEFLEVQHFPNRKNGFGRLKRVLDFRRNPGSTVNDEIASRDRMIRRQQREIETLERRERAIMGEVIDKISLGFLPSDLVLPFPLQNVVRCYNIFDGICLELKEDKGIIHLIEGNYTKVARDPSFTREQRKFIRLKKANRIELRIHSIHHSKLGWEMTLH